MGGNRARLLENAAKHLQKGNLERAIKELVKLVGEEPDDATARVKLGGLLEKTGKVKEAIAQYRVVARSYIGTEVERRAIPVFQKILDLDGSLIDVRVELARLFEKLGMKREALGQYELAAERHETEGRRMEQVDLLRHMLRIEPDHPPAMRKLGEIETRSKRPVGNLNQLEREADDCRSRRDLDGLAKALEKIVMLLDARLEPALELAGVYLDQGETRRALACVNICFGENPSDIRVLDMLVETFQALGLPEKAAAVVREIQKMNR